MSHETTHLVLGLPEGMDDPDVQVLDRRLWNGYHRKFYRIPREPMRFS